LRGVLEITTPYCRQTGVDVGTDTELGERLARWPSPRKWKYRMSVII